MRASMIPLGLAAATAMATPAMRSAQQAPSASPSTGAACTVMADATVTTPPEGFAFADVHIAAREHEALVTFTNRYEGRYDGVNQAGSAWIADSFPRGTRVEQHFNSAAACAASIHVAATRFGSDLTRFTFGWARENGEMGDRHFALTDRRGRQQTDTRWHAPHQLVAAGRDDFALGVSIGVETRCADPCTCTTAPSAPVLRTFAFAAGRTASTVLVRTPNDSPTALSPNAPAVAVGSDRQAIAYRAGNELIVQRIGATGEADGSAIRIASGDVGAPTIAYRGRALIAVWAQRETPSSPYTLRALEWDPALGSAVPAPRVFRAASASDSMMAPSVATDGNRVLIAWSEGDAGRRGRLRIVSTTGDLFAAMAAPATLATSSTNARDPEVALTSDRAWIVWESYARNRPRGELRVARLGGSCAP